jgi:predicted nucleic acid-binding protein
MFGEFEMLNSVYWDTCIFIILLKKDSNDPRLEPCDDMVYKAGKGELTIVTSTITLTEVNRIDGSSKLPAAQSKLIFKFFQNEYIAIRPVDRRTAEMAHEYTRDYGLENMDAIHVASAVIAKAPVLYTYDEKKGKRRGLLRHHLQIGAPALRIEKPPIPIAGPLFAKPAK